MKVDEPAKTLEETRAEEYENDEGDVRKDDNLGQDEKHQSLAQTKSAGFLN